MSKLPFPSVILVDPLVDKLAEIEVESLGVKLVRVNAETLSEKPLDGEIEEVEFEIRSFTIASVNAETLGIALAGKLEELVIELLAMTLTRKSPRHLAPTWLINRTGPPQGVSWLSFCQSDLQTKVTTVRSQPEVSLRSQAVL